MTKIRVDIESDTTIVSAKILLRHADGTTQVEDVQTETSMSDSFDNIKRRQKSFENADQAFLETY